MHGMSTRVMVLLFGTYRYYHLIRTPLIHPLTHALTHTRYRLHRRHIGYPVHRKIFNIKPAMASVSAGQVIGACACVCACVYFCACVTMCIYVYTCMYVCVCACFFNNESRQFRRLARTIFGRVRERERERENESCASMRLVFGQLLLVSFY